MKDRSLKDTFSQMSNQELTFSKEDRDEVFEQLYKMEKNNIQKKSLVSISKKFAPLTVSLLAVGLCLFFFMPMILQENIINKNNETDSIGVVAQEDEYFTTLITVKAKDMDNRIYLNLVLTYSKDKKMMKVLSIPSDTYAPILDKNDGTTSYDKLLFAYAYGTGGAENVRTTVSKLLDLTIDYYAVMDLENFSTVIDSVKGTNHLNGEEVVALLMDATAGKSLAEDDLLNLISTVMNKTKNELPQTQLKELTTKIEGNVPFEQLFENKMELPLIQVVSLIEGMMDTQIDGAYFIKFENDFLNSVSEELTRYN